MTRRLGQSLVLADVDERVFFSATGASGVNPTSAANRTQEL
jgi:hypothetical protein